MKIDYSYQTEKKLILKEKGKITQLDVKDVTHISANDYATTIHIKNSSSSKKYITTKPLTHIETYLKDLQFFKINRKCIINLRYVSFLTYSDNTVTLFEEVKLPVSRRRITELKKLFYK